MGFAKKSRKEAQAQQVAALNMQNQIMQNSLAQNAEYQSNFKTRNAGVIDLQNKGMDFLKRYGKGEDIATLLPASVKMGQQTSDMVQNTMQAASRMGDSSQLPKNQGYQNKLNAVAKAKIGSGLAAINDERLGSEVGNQRDIVMNTSQFLNADSQAGLGLNSQVFGMANGIFNNATTRRQMEIQRSNMMMNNLMQGINGGIQGFGAMFGAGGAFGTGGAFGG